MTQPPQSPMNAAPATPQMVRAVKANPSNAAKKPPASPPVLAPGDDQQESARYRRLLRIITIEAIVIAVLSGLFIFEMPFLTPVHQYFAMNPKSQIVQLVPLIMPNMTKRAILSWATTSITEMMTIGFGDFEQKLGQQKRRFTPEGWESFRTAFVKQKIGEAFKQNQLVLTTVPSNTPVIVAQGVNAKNIYEWRVQMPVIMTYATNNNTTRRERAVIALTIVRVKGDQSPSGIGIDSWSIE